MATSETYYPLAQKDKEILPSVFALLSSIKINFAIIMMSSVNISLLINNHGGTLVNIHMYGNSQRYTCTIHIYHSSLGFRLDPRVRDEPLWVMMGDGLRLGLMNSRLLYPVCFLILVWYIWFFRRLPRVEDLMLFTSLCPYSSAFYRICDSMSDENFVAEPGIEPVIFRLGSTAAVIPT